ncbi:MAG: glucose-1-phosphate cytidylyltransferase [Magnetococcales bacterium]|nr:glucose-1-phosphate cytidylyltransferase [Magnetococcales bacterium]
MKAVILAGGLGTRISEETHLRPKPMVEIGGRPILWHILKIYAAHGIHDFIICCGYKGYVIKEYFSNYLMHMADVTFDLANNRSEIHHHTAEPWRVTLVDTGADTMTGGRIKRIKKYLGEDDFCLTYGDGVGDVDIRGLIAHHHAHSSLATVTAVRPSGRYGALEMEQDRVTRFREKPEQGESWINGGFFVLSPKVLDYIEGDATPWEGEPLTRLAREGQLSAYRHRGFWQAMDTLRDKKQLEALWLSDHPPWKVW